jgi:hypothetical protein
LGRELWETPVGRVVSGMEHAEQFYSYGDMPPWGKGPVQNKIHNGRDYIDTQFPLIDSFQTCTVKRSVLGDSRQAEVQAAVADAPAEAAAAARAAVQEPMHGIRTPVTLSSMKQAAETMRLRRADASSSDTAILVCILVFGFVAACWVTRKLFGGHKKDSDKTS